MLAGDERPLHRAAVRVATSRGVRVHVFEEGYFRPHWITHELGGVNGNSRLPPDPGWFRREAACLPPLEPPAAVRTSFFRRSIDDVLYNLAALAWQRRYPHYRTHRPWPFYVEYASWLRRIARAPLAKCRLVRNRRRLGCAAGGHFLFPLQLDSDYQVRRHSPHGAMAPALRDVIRSFAARAPADAVLAVKAHPLDNAMTNWRALARSLAVEHGVADRIVYLAGGSLESALAGCRGVVTVNSTAGLAALAQGLPVITLGRAIYDIAGLTFGGSLDNFWERAEPPDRTIFDAFRRVVMDRTQINGGFYGAAAVRRAVAGAVAKIERGRQDEALGADDRLARTAAATTVV
ncbi:MAG TPA: capsular biosynthesis protein [Stellaceae bacterium]|nr:capsular biosynthesis protein [Stellaceae bacterium]